MRWRDLLRRLHKGNKETLSRHTVPVNAELLNSTVACKRMTAFPIQKAALHRPGHNQPHNKVLPAMLKCTRVFNEVEANKLSKNKQEDHAINPAGTNTHPFGPRYKLSTNDFKALQDFVSNNLVRGSICQLTLPAGAHTLCKEEGQYFAPMRGL